ncbi:putative Bacterial Ig-like domain (group 1) [Microcystis aeruginosa NIES-2549]|uniref:Ice-binding protein C-terminal domain-containing protein n=2 Tax=Microcystis aeruginosa TaxID=1126 RepID=A0AAD3B3R8_MICAE|nr:PEP-CTERM sorting domain-containing protein [Microcystis aeruginosa]AKE64735.1 putative Bacterial Ig-like domain (group 1) [Microcystis aeruginosa NIES-2549]AOC53135.1 putative Bacterial Ig-like domain (group 1) [Microcystis aeruginosa NIES-2481]GCL60627.1 hypothetical protein NIES3807_38120 [Microcystis aeruginosa NIES-3807]
MKLAIRPLVLSTATFGLMLGVSQNAQAAGLIPRVTASTANSASGWNIANTVNGVGLPSNTPSLTENHNVTNSTNSWRTNTIPVGTPLSSVTIEFNFNRIYNLAGFSFWNLSSSSATQGINTLTIEYKLNTGAWTTLTGPGVPLAFAQGTTSTTSSISPQVFNFSPVYATNVRFSNMTNHGGSGNNRRLGFSEIQFRSIPEPSSTLALLALGLGGVGLRKRV